MTVFLTVWSSAAGVWTPLAATAGCGSPTVLNTGVPFSGSLGGGGGRGPMILVLLQTQIISAVAALSCQEVQSTLGVLLATISTAGPGEEVYNIFRLERRHSRDEIMWRRLSSTPNSCLQRLNELFYQGQKAIHPNPSHVRLERKRVPMSFKVVICQSDYSFETTSGLLCTDCKEQQLPQAAKTGRCREDGPSQTCPLSFLGLKNVWSPCFRGLHPAAAVLRSRCRSHRVRP